MATQNTQQSGFSLIELIITIAIISIVLAIAVPNLMPFINQTRLKGVAENMAQDLVMARAEAIRLNKPLRLDLRSNCYGISSNTTSGCNCTISDTAASNYCEIKRDGDWRNTTLTSSSTFNNILFDSVRGMPVDNAFGILASNQTTAITNSAGTITLSMSLIGSVCLSSTGTKKIAGYPDAC